jgi:hypothetical protein
MYKKGFYTFRGTSVLLTSKDFAENSKARKLWWELINSF